MMKYLKEWSYKVGENSVDILVELINNMTFYSVVIRQGLNEVVIDFDTNFAKAKEFSETVIERFQIEVCYCVRYFQNNKNKQ
ncbi:MAG: hypothetical protein B6I28_01240 [Fusobacteriia bacterium 4572_132]|nr:MAG: hypothetical protein B6I28_01240 [Fusobacteriia bacterium 4572_132]